MDGWTEYFNNQIWLDALEENGLNVGLYTRKHDQTEILPWDFIDINVTKNYLLRELKKAYDGQVTGSCFSGCKGCGVQKDYKCELC